MILLAIAIVIMGLIFYSVFCHAPGEESRKENVDRCITGDYIIRGVNGEIYPCKADIFLKTYEEAEDGK